LTKLGTLLHFEGEQSPGRNLGVAPFPFSTKITLTNLFRQAMAGCDSPHGWPLIE